MTSVIGHHKRASTHARTHHDAAAAVNAAQSQNIYGIIARTANHSTQTDVATMTAFHAALWKKESIDDIESTSHFAAGRSAVPIFSRDIVNSSFSFAHLPERVSACLSIMFAIFHHSEVSFWNAFSTSQNHIFPSSTIFLAACSDTQYIFASSARSGTHASVNCLNSVPYSLQALRTWPYAYQILDISTHVAADTSQSIFIVDTIDSDSTQNARSCFAVSLIHNISRVGDFFARSARSLSIFFDASADHSITSNDIEACSILSHRKIACFQTAMRPAHMSHHHARRSHFDTNQASHSDACVRAFHSHELMSNHTCWNIFQRTETSLSPVLTKFVSDFQARVICFFIISSSPQSLSESHLSHAFRASASSFLTTAICCLNTQRSIAILIASGLCNRFNSCSDCFIDVWSTETTSSASSCSFAINRDKKEIIFAFFRALQRLFEFPQLFAWPLLCRPERADSQPVTSCRTHSYWRWFHLAATYIAQEWSSWRVLMETCSISDKRAINLQKTALFSQFLSHLLEDVQCFYRQTHMFWIDFPGYSDTYFPSWVIARSSLWMFFRKWMWESSLRERVEFAFLRENRAQAFCLPGSCEKTRDILQLWLDHIWEWTMSLSLARESLVRNFSWVEIQCFSCSHYIEKSIFWNKKRASWRDSFYMRD